MFVDENFIMKMNDTQQAVGLIHKYMANNFLGNHKSEKYKVRIAKMIETFKKLGC